MNQVESLYHPSLMNHAHQFQPQHQNSYSTSGPLAFAQSTLHSVPQSPLTPSSSAFSIPQSKQPHQPQSRQSSFGNDSPANVAASKPSQQHLASSQSNPYSHSAFSQQPGVPAAAQAITNQPTPPYSHAGSASPQKRPMAAPPLPASVQQRQQSPHGTSNPSTSQPPSPGAVFDAGREKERVALLLEINLVLLQEMNRLQAEGKGGATNAQQAAILKAQGLADRPAADEYLQVFYRLQANLAYLYSQPDMQALNPQNQGQPQSNRKGPAHPPHFMRPPPGMVSLDDKYATLRTMFPGWQGRDAV